MVGPMVGILEVPFKVVLMEPSEVLLMVDKLEEDPKDKRPEEVVGSIHLEEELGNLGLVAAVNKHMGCLEEASLPEAEEPAGC